VGHQILSQWYYNTSHINETVADSKERMVLAGGYGGWLEENTGGAFNNIFIIAIIHCTKLPLC
jgi:hypothetical protein